MRCAILFTLALNLFLAQAQNLLFASDEVVDKSCQIDILFVNDASGSIGHDDYQKSLDFMVSTLDTLKAEINRGDVTVGVVTYADNPQVVLQLGKYNYDELVGYIQSLYFSYVGGNTNAGKAIELGRTHFVNNRRAGVKSEMVVITDGISLDDVKAPADNARADGIELFAIGVAQYEQSQLEDIAGGIVDNILNVVNYEALAALKQRVVRCDPPQPPKPRDPVDPCDPNPCPFGGVCIAKGEEEYECYQDPDWYLWSGWSACSVSCGSGIQLKFRRCKNHFKAPQLCVQQQNKERVCNMPACLVTETVVMGMTMNREFTDDLLDTTSDAYKALSKEVQDLIGQALAGVNGVTLGQVKSIFFSSGSIKAEVLMDVIKQQKSDLADLTNEISKIVVAISKDIVVDGVTVASAELQSSYKAKVAEAARKLEEMKKNAAALKVALVEEAALTTEIATEKSTLEKMTEAYNKAKEAMTGKTSSTDEVSEATISGYNLIEEMKAKAAKAAAAVKEKESALIAEGEKLKEEYTAEVAATGSTAVVDPMEAVKGKSAAELMAEKAAELAAMQKEMMAKIEDTKGEAEAMKGNVIGQVEEELKGEEDEDTSTDAVDPMEALKAKAAAATADAQAKLDAMKASSASTDAADALAAMKAQANLLLAENQATIDAMDADEKAAAEKAAEEKLKAAEAAAAKQMAEVQAKMNAMLAGAAGTASS